MTLDELGRHREALLKLATRLAGDHETAEDLVQMTYLRALEKSAAGVRSPGSWLAGILKKFALQTARDEGRRRARELHAAKHRREHLPEDSHTYVLNLLLNLLGTLREPYGSTLKGKYLDGHTAKGIADRDGIPLATVHTRLKRGMDLLREALDRECDGDRRNWLLSLLQALEQPPRLFRRQAARHSPALLGTVVAVSIGFLVVTLVAVLDRSAYPNSIGLPTVASATAAGRGHAQGPSASGRQPGAASLPALSTQSHEVMDVRGHVFDVRGQPVPEANVTFTAGTTFAQAGGVHVFRVDVNQPESLRVTSSADGSYRIQVPARTSGRLHASTADCVPLVVQTVTPIPKTIDVCLVIAPRSHLRGTVADDSGKGLPETALRLWPNGSLLALLRTLAPYGTIYRPVAQTDAKGRFEVTGAYALEECDVVLTRPDGRTSLHQLSWPYAQPLCINWSPSAATPDVVRGRVVNHLGAPVPDAHVLGGVNHATTDANGAFAWNAPELHDVMHLEVLARDWLPVTFTRPTEGHAPLDWPKDIEIVLRDRPLTIEGNVVDSDGAHARARVYLTDPTPLSEGADGTFKELIGERCTVHFWPYVETDDDGHFTVSGLLNRAYRLTAVVDSLLCVQSSPIQAGTHDALLQLPPTDRLGPLSGRLVAADGLPLSGVHMTAVVRTTNVQYRDGSAYHAWRSGPETLTDDEGRFSFASLPPDVELRFEGSGVYGGQIVIPAPHRKGITIVGSRVARLRMNLVTTPPSGVMARFKLPNGQFTKFRIVGGSSNGNALETAREAYFDAHGRSGPLIVPDSISHVVLFRGSTALLTTPISLRAGELNQLDL